MNLIIGYGQIGQAIERILPNTICIDKGQSTSLKIYALHICFGYSKDFVKEVKRYKKLYRPKLVVIHSTVKAGTTDKLKACYSPCRGVHPNLEQGIRTFIKYFAGYKARPASRIFEQAGVKVKVVKDTKSLETAKLLDTTYYGWNIIFEKWVWEYCWRNKLNYSLIYKEMNESYNTGYKALGMENVCRPVLKHIAGKIGGHCIIPNLKLLRPFKPAEQISKKNSKL